MLDVTCSVVDREVFTTNDASVSTKIHFCLSNK